jgi:UPF0755 protein
MNQSCDNTPKKTSAGKKAIFVGIGSVFLLLVLALGIICHNLVKYANTPVSQERGKKCITVKPGDSFARTIKTLYGSGLINSPEKFRIIARITGYDKKIKAGEYLLDPSMSPYAILFEMVSGKVRLHRFTIPEGYNIYQIAEIAQKEGFCTKEDFLRTATSSYLTKSFGFSDEVSSFEGYLFPETYYFPMECNEYDIIETMVKRFNTVFNSEYRQRAADLEMTVHEILTLASIIEKETGVDYERPLISSVFHNRLKKNMRLETDPTVIYGIKNFDGNITKKHLRTKTPYNTYKIKGLPPGPIANPGEQSIKAALYPDETDYLYFVSRKDSTHQFSTNITDHINSVNKYQLRRRR